MTMCAFEGCERPNFCKGFCQSHYQQQRRGNELKPLMVKRANANYEGMTEKTCLKCGKTKPVSEFYGSKSKYGTECKVCLKGRSRVRSKEATEALRFLKERNIVP